MACTLTTNSKFPRGRGTELLTSTLKIRSCTMQMKDANSHKLNEGWKKYFFPDFSTEAHAHQV